ncbi:MAG: 2-hydroxychromene-2-carboxylate isomerase [Pseudomonadota bacterium]|nr:2-hydroxychromene-2-carboxylate isomerase [Pseudomonadota bacterium]
MKLDWYFDFVSPFSYLQLERFDRLPAGTEVTLKPILFGALLKHLNQRGPAEIPHKREFTYKHVQWQADQAGIPLRFPPAHPFNPVRALRVAIALGNDIGAVRAIFRFIWQQGRLPDEPENWQALTKALGVHDAEGRIAQQSVKDRLRQNGEDAKAAGVFGVPTFAAGNDLFWGFDATPMLIAYLNDAGVLNTDEMLRISQLPAAVERKV